MKTRNTSSWKKKNKEKKILKDKIGITNFKTTRIIQKTEVKFNQKEIQVKLTLYNGVIQKETWFIMNRLGNISLLSFVYSLF